MTYTRCCREHTMTLCLQIGLCVCPPRRPRGPVRRRASRWAGIQRDLVSAGWGVLLALAAAVFYL